MDNNSSNQIMRLNENRSRGSYEDRISELPDVLLQHILTFVSTISAVRTSVLSRSWRSVWKEVPYLDLNADYLFPDEFIDVVNTVLELRGDSYLQKFKLKTSYPITRSQVEGWIETVVGCRVEHLEVEHDHEDEELCFNMRRQNDKVCFNKMPQCLCVCNTLVVLKLKYAILDVPEHVSLSSLKIMDLDNVKFTEEAGDSGFERLIIGCPVLKELSINRISDDNLMVLSVSSRTLKRLSIIVQEGGQGDRVVIDAPRLEHLKLHDYKSKDFVLRNLTDFEADIQINFNELDEGDLWEAIFQKGSNIQRFLLGFSNVKSLKIALDTLEIFSQYTTVEELPKFQYLCHLGASVHKERWEMLPVFLECCPNLKSFILYDLKKCFFEDPEPFGLPSTVPRCMSSSLESIKLRMLITGDATEMGLIKYFLANSAVLKEMKLCLSQNLDKQRGVPIIRELLSFPKRSTACRLYLGRR